MKHIDKLIIKAKTISNKNDDKLIVAFITFENDKWYTSARVWNCKRESGLREINNSFNTFDEAVKEIHKIAEQHPNDEEITIIVDDGLE